MTSVPTIIYVHINCVRYIARAMGVPSHEYSIFVTLLEKLDMLPSVSDCKRKQNGQFIRNKCKNKRRRVSLGEHKIKAENIAEMRVLVMKQNYLNGHLSAHIVGDSRRIVELGYLGWQKQGSGRAYNSLSGIVLSHAWTFWFCNNLLLLVQIHI